MVSSSYKYRIHSTLSLLIFKDTPIFSQDGTVYKGELKNQKLVVFYTKSTKGIPEETHPDRIIVVSEENEAYVADNKIIRD